ncbi:unnamed protein product [Soboliphyme baturini]|uniref:Uncharacterized protein n=1 Tax=Soboliphyme baturini TaxID=241478 RepID=A0A183IIK8_9BILA|nr:unnamed protein product [Soboliphyme baturini]
MQRGNKRAVIIVWPMSEAPSMTAKYPSPSVYLCFLGEVFAVRQTPLVTTDIPDGIHVFVSSVLGNKILFGEVVKMANLVAGHM